MVKRKFPKSLFFPPKDKVLAKKIRIDAPGKFKKSIAELKKGGITLKEMKALTLARTRARVQLKRPNLSTRERNQMKAISKMRIPRVTKR